MILISYDGSDDSQVAIDHAGSLMPGAEATVITVWERFLDAMLHSGAMGIGMGFAGVSTDDSDPDAATEEAALSSATKGAERAGAAGLVAMPRAMSRVGGIAQTLLIAAAEIDADLIIVGTRGLGGVKSLLLGSVSHELVQHADRSVLVVPSNQLAEQRRAWTHHLRQPVG